jgi:uncharacterized membrane protein YfhO
MRHVSHHFIPIYRKEMLYFLGVLRVFMHRMYFISYMKVLCIYDYMLALLTSETKVLLLRRFSTREAASTHAAVITVYQPARRH